MDALKFIEGNLKIQDKRGQIVPLIFNPAQLKLYQEIKRQQSLAQPVRIIILKARQVGFSTAVAALFYQRTVNNANTNSMIVAHKAAASANIFAKTKLFYELSPSLARPLKKASNAHELIFENPSKKLEDKEREPGLRSKIRIETAGAKDAGRSTTIHNLHLSELAFWPHASETMLSLMQAVPYDSNTMVIIESTAQGVGGEFYQQWQRAIKGQSEFTPLFFPWWQHQEYSFAGDDGKEATAAWEPEELALLEDYQLSPAQLQWRRWCISSNCGGDIDRFAQEYPAHADEAFLVSGRPVFASRSLALALQAATPPLQQGELYWQSGAAPISHSQVEFVAEPQGNLAIYQQPSSMGDYWLGVDAASGVLGGDYSAMVVIERNSLLPVAFWHGRVDPDLLGEAAVRLAIYYNRAMIVPESNNHGIAVISTIRRLHWPRLYRSRHLNHSQQLLSSEYGFHTTQRSKNLIINNLKRYIREDASRMTDKPTIEECISYVYEDNGATNARSGCHDDRVMAFAIALYAAGETKREGKPFVEEDYRELYGANSTTGY